MTEPEPWTMLQQDSYGNAKNPKEALTELATLLKPSVGDCVLSFDPEDQNGRDQILFHFPTTIDPASVQEIGGKVTFSWQANAEIDCQARLIITRK